jgi:hypothetical protein
MERLIVDVVIGLNLLGGFVKGVYHGGSLGLYRG